MQVPSLASFSGLRILCCCVGHRRGSDLAPLWLWCRLAATEPIRPLAWEAPYAVGVALKGQKKKKKKEKRYTRKKDLQIYSEKAALCKPRRQVSRETKPAHTMIMGF